MIATMTYGQETEGSTALASLRLANELMRYGYTHNNVFSLVNALQIYSLNPSQSLNATKESEGGSEDDGEKRVEVSFDYEKVLADAKKMAAGDDVLLAMIDNIDKKNRSAQRGSIDGPSMHYDRVRAQETHTYTVSFVAGHFAEVAVSGDGETDLDLYVYDAEGKLIKEDRSRSRDCYVSWKPEKTGRYKIKVVNCGKIYNNYIIGMN